MKNMTAKNVRRALGPICSKIESGSVIGLIAFLLLVTNLASASTVSWVSGGINKPKFPTGAGYADGATDGGAEYHTPCGIALDSSGSYLFVADRDNNAIRYLDLGADETWTFGIIATNLISKPIGVAVDSSLNVFVLNRGNGTNGTVVEFDNFGETLATNATGLTNVGGIALDGADNIYVTASNTVFRISGTSMTTIATITNAGASLQGLVLKRSGITAGLLAVCDAGRNGIYLIDPASGIVTTNAGFHGAGDFTTNGNDIASSSTAKFNQPMNIVEAGDGTLVVTDYGNNRVKVVLASGVVTGVVTNLYGVTSQYWSGTYPGFSGGTSATDSGLSETPEVPDSKVPNASARLPYGVAFAPDGTLYTTEDYYHIIRKVTGSGLTPPPPAPPAAPTGLTATTNYGEVTLMWTAVFGATNYDIERSPSSSGPYTIIGNTSSTTYTDTNVINGTTYYYVVSAVNAGGQGPNSAEVSAKPPIPPPSAPIIGWFDYEGNDQTGFFTVLHPVSIATFYNDVLVAINPTVNGISTYYIAGPAPLSGVPSSTNGSTPPFYQDGLGYAQALSLTTVPDLIVKAVNVNPGGSSPVVTAEFIFQVANPVITGNNAAQFTISDQTTNAVFWYTTDGSTPSNGAPSIGPITNNPATISLNITSNTVFTVRAFRNGYQPSGSAIQLFSPTNFVPNTISFGFASGQASSDFVAAPGETFYAPVTLSVLPSTVMYSLQFNVTVTNAGPNPGPPVAAGAFGFSSMLEKPIPGSSPVVYEPIPPYMFIGDATGNVPPSQIVNYQGTNFVDLELANTNINLLALGWLERAGAGETNLYDTTAQDLIQFSQAHDTLFQQGGGQVIIGGFAFQVPLNATSGQTYQIQIGRPSATSDGIGAPGSSIFIYAPTNSSLGGGAINALKNVTAGQRKYIVGDVYPFRWFNAGDFGETNLEDADVEQVFQTAVYLFNDPPPGSDFHDAMDSCGITLASFDGDTGFYTNSPNVADLSLLFEGNDSTIDQMAYGDGQLDVCDVYVTFRRSLDPSRVWFRRFWTNGVLVAETTSNVFNSSVISKVSSKAATPTSQNQKQSAVSNLNLASQPQVNFSATDFVASAGQVLNIPITAQIFGSYPLRVLMLNLSVEPLDGSPTLTTPVQFTANPVLGQPYKTDSTGNGNYAAVWLNSTNAGLTGSAVVGTLTVTIPPTATTNSAYDIHFDHASASPNGIASFPKQTLTGLVTLSSRTNSTYGDGIPDSWRLRWFGTIDNLLSVSNACPSGDGINNWMKYVAGVDPNTASDFPSTSPVKPVPSGSTMAIHWPTISGKQYVILRSSSLFSGKWSSIATNTGSGTDMEFDDTTSGQTQFYRVQILP
jgi:hypothetical protein